MKTIIIVLLNIIFLSQTYAQRTQPLTRLDSMQMQINSMQFQMNEKMDESLLA